jgi:uncharacterized membrane protein
VSEQAIYQPRVSARPSTRTGAALGLLLVFAVAARFIVHYALPYFAFDPAYFKAFWPHRIQLVLHIAGGMITLVCGPLQFWTGLRRRSMTLHRAIGKLYLAGVAVGAFGGYWLAAYSVPHGFGVAIMFMSTAWLFTTAAAYASILRGLVVVHQQWMIRSYIVTFAFVTIRLLIDNLPFITSRLGGSLPERVINVVWVSWLVPLMVYEVWVLGKKLAAGGRLESAAS